MMVATSERDNEFGLPLFVFPNNSTDKSSRTQNVCTNWFGFVKLSITGGMKFAILSDYPLFITKSIFISYFEFRNSG